MRVGLIKLLVVTVLVFSLFATMTACDRQETFEDIFRGMKKLSIDGSEVTVTKNGISATFNENGELINIEGDDFSLSLEGFYADVGIDNTTALNQVAYESFLDFNTWEIPTVRPTTFLVPQTNLDKIYHDDKKVVTQISMNNITWQYIYSFEDDNLLKVSVKISINEDHEEPHHINGITYIAKGMELDTNETIYQFPGNSPYNLHNVRTLSESFVGRTHYSNPVIHFETEDSHLNLLYLNFHEKWGTGVYRDRQDFSKITVANTAATESFLSYGEVLDELGDFYFMFPGDDPYTPIVDFYESQGWVAPTDGVNDGAVYEGHPYGTMDSGFIDLKSLQEYADYIPTIAHMGYKNIWLLPIFDHARGSVYASNDQHTIDLRYGGEEGLIAYTDKAAEYDLRVLLDYVPHGPYPYMPLSRDNPEWSSKKMDGYQQIEWDCVSFDYNHPEFYEYMVESVFHHASQLGVGGARIDCAMGGLSNWDTLPGLRPSSSGLKAGLSVSKAIREGFLNAEKTPIIFPENFHPVPYFAPVTDAFYDMTLYRTIFDLRNSNHTETGFAMELTRWLSVQNKTAPKGQVYLRYISNHDTVSWVWDEARPVVVHGTEKAKALWTLTHLIDGIPMIYQGDEDPALHKGTGEVLIDFFTELNSARDEYLSHDYDIEYILNRSAIASFRRFTETHDRLVLINLSSRELTFDIEGYEDILYQNAEVQIKDNTAHLGPYATVMLDKSN